MFRVLFFSATSSTKQASGCQSLQHRSTMFICSLNTSSPPAPPDNNHQIPHDRMKKVKMTHSRSSSPLEPHTGSMMSAEGRIRKHQKLYLLRTFCCFFFFFFAGYKPHRTPTCERQQGKHHSKTYRYALNALVLFGYNVI